jgi:hypothetical protein
MNSISTQSSSSIPLVSVPPSNSESDTIRSVSMLIDRPLVALRLETFPFPRGCLFDSPVALLPFASFGDPDTTDSLKSNAESSISTSRLGTRGTQSKNGSTLFVELSGKSAAKVTTSRCRVDTTGSAR